VFEVHCPCCGARLIVDDKTRQIISHTSQEDQAKSADERFSDTLERVRRAKAEQERKFQEAQEKERQRKERVASLFDEASKKVKDKGEEGPPRRVWD
jgi:non-homologous end joining protein Ku